MESLVFHVRDIGIFIESVCFWLRLQGQRVDVDKIVIVFGDGDRFVDVGVGEGIIIVQGGRTHVKLENGFNKALIIIVSYTSTIIDVGT